MKTGKYALREFFSDRDLNTIIIPEIQRDYVWGEEQVKKFLESIVDGFKEYQTPKTLKSIQCEDDNVKLEFEKFYKRNYLSTNIGFIYAYSDSDYPGSYFLIDGQQRFTTIYLMLLVLAANGEKEVLAKFKRTYINEEKPKLDYRVREASHMFLTKLVHAIERAKNELTSIWVKRQSWYLKDYDYDATISSIITNIDVITNFLKEKKYVSNEENIIKVDIDFWNYVEDYLEFWFFDTNISEQGEELYIYMNARGESMQDHENLKADLIGKLNNAEAKQNYGKKWEDWQDLFWKNRGGNSNADKGFNEFLCCIAGLENFLHKRDDIPGWRDHVKDVESIPYDYKLGLLSMELIEKYFIGFTKLINNENIDNFSRQYNYTDWIKKALQDVWKIFNGEKSTNWFADYKDDNKSTERNHMVYIWSMLYYMKSLDEADLKHVYRTLRLFYVRYKNNNRAVEKSIENVSDILSEGPWSPGVLNDDEESEKYGFLVNNSECEEMIWKIEDHPLNLDGSNVGNINCSHLVEFSEKPTLEKLTKIYNRFVEIFPINNDRYQIAHPEQLLNALLFTSIDVCDAKPFCDKRNTSYYERLFFDNEKRYIRGLSSYGENKVFSTFFSKFVDDGEYTDKGKDEVELIMTRCEIEKDKIDTNKIIWALAWYAAVKGNHIWNEGKCFIYN